MGRESEIGAYFEQARTVEQEKQEQSIKAALEMLKVQAESLKTELDKMTTTDLDALKQKTEEWDAALQAMRQLENKLEGGGEEKAA